MSPPIHYNTIDTPLAPAIFDTMDGQWWTSKGRRQPLIGSSAMEACSIRRHLGFSPPSFGVAYRTLRLHARHVHNDEAGVDAGQPSL